MVEHLPHEAAEGNVEYKLKIRAPTARRFEELATQMKFRLDEKGGEAFYILGVGDDGEPVGLGATDAQQSLRNLVRVADEIGARCTVVREAQGKRGQILEVLVRKHREEFPVQVSVVNLGHADHGKTTTVGVLLTGRLDDGDGSIMAQIARYKHEIELRRTSSVSERILGFDADGVLVNHDLPSPLDEASVYLRSSKIVSFVDIGGHEKYLRTAAKGLLSHTPDYAMLTVAANAGPMYMTKEHMGISISLRIPFFIVVTKTDLVDEARLRSILEGAQFLLKMPGISKIPFQVRNRDDAILAARHMPAGRVAPIFTLSNRTGHGIDLIERFLNALPPRLRWKEMRALSLLTYVDEKYNITGIGVVVAGLVSQGCLRAGDFVWIGPFPDGQFRRSRVKTIQVRRGVFVERAEAGTSAAFALSGVEYDEVQKGMVLLPENSTPQSVRRFRADVLVLHHPTTIREGYECVFHIQACRVTCRISQLGKTPLRSGDKASVVVETMFQPIFVQKGEQLLFREGRTRGIGKITEVVG